jgi:hypothetical protein
VNFVAANSIFGNFILFGFIAYAVISKILTRILRVDIEIIIIILHPTTNFVLVRAVTIVITFFRNKTIGAFIFYSILAL